jgi:uncharacterized protein YprB with RNaseH-like and TPR domain
VGNGYGELATRLPAGAPSIHGSNGSRAADARATDAAAALGGRVLDTSRGPCVVIDRRYAATHLHGRLRLGECAGRIEGITRGWHVVGGLAGIERLPLGDVVFVDLETTGIAGGAGTHAFLVGCAWFEDESFLVRQFFMAGHAFEQPLLDAVAERFAHAEALVTYNGKTFDVPVLETRFLFHRRSMPGLDCPHLDMLHPARRLWRGVRPVIDTPGAQSESCSLGTLERALFGVARYRDVPGFEIPARYFGFLRSGNASPLEPVLEHNRLDLVSLAAVTARAFALVDGSPDASTDPRECLGIARLLDRAGSCHESEAWLERTLALTDRSWHAEHAAIRCEALRALAIRARRASRYAEAEQFWDAITRVPRCPPGVLRDALQALAVHHEHRSRDLARARAFAQASRRFSEAPGSRAALEQRLARLDRKIGQATPGPEGSPRTTPLWG